MDQPSFLDAASILAYEPLTPRPFVELLHRAHPAGHVLAIGQSVDGLPIGLVLAEGCSPGQVAKVEWLYVDRSWRNQGMADTLLRRLAETCVERRCQAITMMYYENRPSTPALERVLDHTRWDRSDRRVMCLVMGDDVHRLLEARWMRPRQLPAGFTLNPWHEVSQEELKQLYEEHQQRPVYEEYLAPFTACYERDYSFALRHHGRLIGWMITQRSSARIVRYQYLFVRAEYRRRSYAVALLLEAIRRHYAAERHWLPTAGGVWFTHKRNLPMLRFIRRRLGPYLTSIHDVTLATKRISS